MTVLDVVSLLKTLKKSIILVLPEAAAGARFITLVLFVSPEVKEGVSSPIAQSLYEQ
jgi:hypothetical protein